MTAHEHWLICPMHLLWKYGKKPCDGPDCVRCIARRRPAAAGLAVDRRDRSGAPGTRRPGLPLAARPRGASSPRDRRPAGPPALLPARRLDRAGSRTPSPSRPRRPYLAAAGRLVRMKGFQRLIPLMRLLPEVDLRIAGTGPFEAKLRDAGGRRAQRQVRGAPRRPGAGPAVPRGPGGGRALALPGDVRLRRPRSLRRPDAGDRPRGRRGDPRDRRPERRRARLQDRRRAAPGHAAAGPRRRPPRGTGPPGLRHADRRMVRDGPPRPLFRA